MITSIKDILNAYLKIETELRVLISSCEDIARERDHYKRLYESKHQRNINIAKRCIHYCNNNCNLKRYYCDGKCSRFKERKA